MPRRRQIASRLSYRSGHLKGAERPDRCRVHVGKFGTILSASACPPEEGVPVFALRRPPTSGIASHCRQSKLV